MRLRLVLALLLLASALHAQTVRMVVEFSGSKVGFNRYERKPDGNFESETEFTLGSIKFKSVIRGRFEQDRVASFQVEQDQPQRVRVSWSAGKASIEANGQKRELDVPWDGLRAFGNVHPQLTGLLLRGADPSKPEPQKIRALFMDGSGMIEPTVKVLGEKRAAPGLAREYEVMMGQLAVRFLITAPGTVVAMDVPVQKLRFVAGGWEGLFVDPLAAFPELSQPTFKVKTETVRMKTRDGVDLVADVVRPDAPGKFPVILTRTPYGRAASAASGLLFAERGYVFVSQDCRGRGESGGEWDPFVNERKDGYDTIEWLSKAPWSDGKVGMIGASYGGLVQWAAAVERHPALKCIVPQVSPPDAFRNIPYDHGTFFLYGNVWWGKIVRGKDADLSTMQAPLPHPEKFATLPLSKVDDEVLGQNVPFFDRWLERESLQAFKGFDWVSELGRVDVPALHVSGWWDGDLIGTMTNWSALRRARKPNQWLLYGPWTHAFNTTSKLGEFDYGPSAILELDSLYLRWFDTWLNGKEVGMQRVPKVRAFVTGANRWLDLDDWPSDKASKEGTLYLASEGPANGGRSVGELRSSPAATQEPSRYVFNPANAEIPKQLFEMDPSKATVVHEIKVREDDDMLVFKSAAVSAPTAVAGPAELTFRFQTSARDTDFFAFLVDIDPNGVMKQICMPGKLRASYLQGFDKRRPLTPGRTYTATIRLWDFAHELPKGHRLGLVLTSGMFPMFARNLGTGEPIKDATRMVVQANTILHDAKHPSFLKLRVLWGGL